MLNAGFPTRRSHCLRTVAARAHDGARNRVIRCAWIWRWWCLLLLVASCGPLTAREGTPPPSLQRQVQPTTAIQLIALPATDPLSELAADAQSSAPLPLRYAVGRPVRMTPETHGTWETLPDGRLWRLRITSPGATDLNLGFTTFWLPDGATLHVSAAGENYVEGPFTSLDNKPHGQLWTPVVPGDTAIIELFVPAQVTEPPRLVLTQVSAGYRDLLHRKSALQAAVQPPPTSGCNTEVVCPEAAAWSNEVRSVALYSIRGTLLCSGTLIANAAGDFRNYFLSAAHCGLDPANASSVVVYWNYQSPTCGQHSGGSLAQNQSGATFRATRFDVDFSLIELDDMPSTNFHVYYSGWDRSGTAPAGAVGIHHPSRSEKCILFSSNALTTVDNCIGTGGVATDWQVWWDYGETLPGSSGSGIWNAATHLLVGTLSGGLSSCIPPNGPDCYGKLSVAWDNAASAANRLKDWLDPQNTGALTVHGADPQLATIIRPAGAVLVTESCSPTNGAIDPGETVTVRFALKNVGGVSTKELVATLLATNGVRSPSGAQTYGTVVIGGTNVVRSFTFTATGSCGGIILPTFQLKNDSTNLGTVNFPLTLGVATPAMLFSENFDSVTAPALPAGWTSVISGTGVAWQTSTALADTPPNSVVAADPGAVTDNVLISPVIPIVSTNAQLTFKHRFDLESGLDGGVLEVSINGDYFTDILDAGGSFVNNGYNSSLSIDYENPLGGQEAWSGSSGGFIPTIVNLPPTAAGGNIQLRWRLGTDTTSGTAGWRLDSVAVTETVYHCCPGLLQPLLINPRRVGAGSMTFSYNTVTGQTYFVEAAARLAATGWAALQTNAGNGTLLAYTNSIGTNQQHYFRVRTQ